MNNPNAIDPKYFEAAVNTHSMDIEKLIKLIDMIDSDEASTTFTHEGESMSGFELECELAKIGALVVAGFGVCESDLKGAKEKLEACFDNEFNRETF